MELWGPYQWPYKWVSLGFFTPIKSIKFISEVVTLPITHMGPTLYTPPKQRKKNYKQLGKGAQSEVWPQSDCMALNW